MSSVRRADPGARRQAILFVAVTVLLGTLLVLGVDRYAESLREWILSDPEAAPRRLKTLFALFAVAASAPLLAFAAYVWNLGAQVIRSGQFPPPGQRVLRDTEVVDGRPAISRGRALKVFAMSLAALCVLFWILLWRLTSMLRPSV
jgi:hypothetical protein